MIEILMVIGWFVMCICAGWGFADILQVIFTDHPI